MPTKVFIGKNVLFENKNLFLSLGQRCLIVTSKTAAKKSGAYNDLINILDSLNIQHLLYDHINQNPSAQSCIEAGKLGYQNNVDFIIGIGGGSALDAAKAVSIFASNPQIDEKGMYDQKYDHVLPIVCIGTTSGTGSEVTKVAVLTNSKGLKKSTHNDLLYPTYSFGDPTYTMSLNEDFTKSTSLDAIAHALESYFSRKANTITRSYSIDAIKLILPILNDHKENLTNLTYKEREDLYIGSILAGLAISQTGTCFPHTLGYYLSESKNIPHGYACALYTNDIVEYCLKVDKQYTLNFFNILNISVDDFKNLINELLPKFNIEFSEKELDDLLPRYFNNSSILNTIGSISIEEIKEIIQNKLL